MKKYTTLFIMFLLVSGLKAQENNAASFIREAISLENDTVSNYYLRDSAVARFYPDWESDSTMIEGLIKDIGQKEVTYLLAQRKNLKNGTWNGVVPKSVQVIDEAYLKKTFKGKNKTKNWQAYYNTHQSAYYEVSQPVFTSDKKYAIVYIALQCGTNCGHGGASLYVFENGKWKIVRNIFSWINN